MTAHLVLLVIFIAAMLVWALSLVPASPSDARYWTGFAPWIAVASLAALLLWR